MDSFPEAADVVVYTDCSYNERTLKKCRELHESLIKSGKLKGAFESDRWMGYSDVKWFGLDFSMNPETYQSHAGGELGISAETMRNMLRCYALYCHGLYVYDTISQVKLRSVRDFLQKYGEKDFRMSTEDICAVLKFLAFINTPEREINRVFARVRLKQAEKRKPRTLSPIMNYLVIENEINDIFQNEPDEETFRKWFPIYFWVNITFVLPLRATEMLLTPKNCVRRDDGGKTVLTVRRTKLKRWRNVVCYDVNKDYGEFSYEIPDSETVRNIEKYQRLTSGQDRRFLFEYNGLMINEMLSLEAFNRLLSMFIEERIVGNPRYEFAKYAAGIQEFETVTAGDSRPIAMANLYFQNVGEDICRQLADHMRVDVSAGYYTNISETIWASSVIHLQKKLEYERRYYGEQYQRGALTVIDGEDSRCVSERRFANKADLSDCVAQGHLEDCMGCRYYRPSREELADFMETQKKKADESAKRVIDFMNRAIKAKNPDFSLEEAFLSVQTDASRYRMACDISAKERYAEWQERKNIRKTCF